MSKQQKRPKHKFERGFKEWTDAHPGVAGDALTAELYPFPGAPLAFQDCERGRLFWLGERGVTFLARSADEAPPAPEPTPEPDPEAPPAPEPQPEPTPDSEPEPGPPPPPVAGGRLGALFADPPSFDAALPILKATLAAGVGLRVAAIHMPQGTAKGDAMLGTIGPDADVLWNLDPGSPLPAPDAFAAYCAGFASRWPGRTWTLLNEPAPTAANAALVIAAADAIHAADPTARVVGPEVQAGKLTADWLRPMVDHLDAISVHVIPSLAIRADVLAKAKAALATVRSVTDKPAYLGEVGASSNLQYAEPGYEGEDGQARWAAEVLPQLLGMGWDRCYWALLTDGRPYQPGKAYGDNGLYSADYRPKAAWGALAALVGA